MRRGKQLPRVQVAPTAYDSNGHIVADLSADCGIELDPWQRHVLDVSLATGRDGKWAALQSGLIVPRQNGKTAIMAALCLGMVLLNLDGVDEIGTPPTIIYSAHEFKTAKETFRLASRMVQNGPLRRRWLKNRESGVETGIEFKTGARILFVARSGSSGRGFSGDLVVFDEAFALQQKMLGALLPTLSARPNPQVWLSSSAAMHDSTALHKLMARANGTYVPDDDDDEDEDELAYMEWSIEPGSRPNSDRDGWAEANPALGYRLTERFIKEELRTLDAREFERERLGVPDDADGATAFDVARWQTLIDGDSSIPRPLGIGFDVTPERDQAAIAVAGVRMEDARAHVETSEYLPGTEWCMARLVELWNRWEAPIWIELGSPAAAFAEPLRAKNVDVRTLAKLGGHDPLFADAVTNGTVRHLGQASLTSALIGARKKVSGDTWSYSRGSSTVDICPLKAASLAHYGAMVEPAVVPVRVGIH